LAHALILTHARLRRPDAVGSRLLMGTRWRAIGTRAELTDTLRRCLTPEPVVEFVDHVADFKKLINPRLKKTYAGEVFHLYCSS